MSRMHLTPAVAGLALIGLLSISACTAQPGAPAPISSDAPAGQSLGSLMPGPPDAAVIGTGTIMDIGGDVQLCLGPVAESYPPQCSGIPVTGWIWDGVDGSEQLDDVRWGTYAVTGDYDGESLTVTAPPVLLALYDAMPAEDASERRGAQSDEDLQQLQDEIATRFSAAPEMLLGSSPANGLLLVDVVWDDGTMQQAADDDFGADAVVIRSALREVE
ncbi:hypothetical protein [Microbacterium sp. NPDC056234]|uniref:hypothetical protein n=1 Tax=Microbacterium sp. NPDC056234 TaxID=3345757 RepID=UPI0035D90E4B